MTRLSRLRWRDLSLRTKTLVLVALPASPIVLLWALIVISLISQQRTPASMSAARRLDLAARLSQSEVALAQAEAAAREAAGGRSSAVARFDRAASEATAQLAYVEGAFTDDSNLSATREIRALAERHLEGLSRVARGGPGADRTALDESAETLARVHALVASIFERRGGGQTDTQRSRTRNWVTLLVLFGASAVGITVGIVGAVMLGRTIGRRAEQMARMSEALVRGEPLGDPPTGHDELAVLGRRLHEASVQLRQQQTALEASNHELEAFSYSVSHDLRAPLRAIDGFSQVIQEDASDRLDPASQDALRRVRNAATRMGLLIDEMLNLSRISRQDLRREHVDLSELALSVATDLRRREEPRDVAITIAPAMTVQADPRLLRIAVTNLLDNAWKYTSRTAGARIEFTERSENGERVFQVRDNGAGFDMAYAGKLFAAFQRLHTDREFDGTGIGLATVSRIIHRHGGRIWAEGAVGAGATFSFTIESPGPAQES